ncbi:hypothetical protein [Novosphingobium colocasiae]|uniref:Uncharacterized protein n=1 Tax=Novosphingobium colocasiae TaxID=1256513 RepID=A0A918PJE8_9SPHN|nr:hypothetical protein [Novosphingobium colocasiae]GGZ10587.1 hypothetical protein GCM10011614_26890 [Novosphingobium colocasiae]
MTRRLNLLLLVFIATIGFPFYWYFLDNGLGTAHPRPLTMAQLRELAASLPGEPPLELRHEMLGYRLTMRNLTEAGGGVRDTRTSLRAYQVRLTDGRTIAIGRGIGAKRARKTDLLGYDPDAQHRVDEAVRRASIHLLLSPAPESEGDRPDEPRDAPFPRAIAPGVVVIPLDDVAPGMAMVYLRMADQREFLLTGDVAPVRANWRDLRPPARYATATVHDFNRDAQIGWLMTINALHREAPHMTIVEGRDPSVIPQAPRGFAP